MRIINRIRAIALLISIIFCTNTVNSQVIVERSKDKVIISGVAYYIHQVKKGETAYSISKAYGITVTDLTSENPPAVYGINVGQSLRIPVRMVTDTKPSETIAVKREHDESKFIYHIMKPGETIYSLSKSFGVSENEILQSNQWIDINKLSVGTEIAIPKREFMSIQQKFDDKENKYSYHKVLMGETLASIAKLYGLTVRQLRRENRDLRFPRLAISFGSQELKKLKFRRLNRLK